MALVRSGGSSLRGSLSRGSGARWILVDFLRCQNDEQISALSWSPCGRYPENVFLLYCFVFIMLSLDVFSHIWHQLHMTAHLSPYGMFLKVTEGPLITLLLMLHLHIALEV